MSMLLLAEVNLRTGHAEQVIEPLNRLMQAIAHRKATAMLLATT